MLGWENFKGEMSMKKLIVNVLSGLMLLSFNPSFAANLTCPSEQLIKAQSLISGYPIEDQYWTFKSAMFVDKDGYDWQIMFTAKLPSEIKHTPDALQLAQRYFDKTPVTRLDSIKDHGMMLCNYTLYNKSDDDIGYGTIRAIHAP